MFLTAQSKASNDGQVYYYKQTGVVKNNVKTAGDNTGQFISFTFVGCYDSTNQKYDVGNGFLAYKGLQNNLHKYSGRSYWGENSDYYYSADFNKLNVYAPDGLIYVYEKATAPAGVVTCAKIYKPPEQPRQSTTIVDSYPVYPVTPVTPPNTNTYTPSPNTNTYTPPSPKKLTCSSCGGSGLCKYCRGSGRCPTCGGIGVYGGVRCPGCNGSLKCNYCYVSGNGKCYQCKGNGEYKENAGVIRKCCFLFD